MPIYEYQCADCGERIERLQAISDPPPAACELCGGAMRRAVSVPAFQFKGSGWYVTDYAGRKGSEEAGEAPASAETPAKAKSDSGPDKGASSEKKAGSEKSAPAEASKPAKTTQSSS